ncbi:acetate kinase [Bacteroidales bacterium OttesenSCG-928-B11]|nr:acetate kinase [Bacteroidales bacterium OttesenSCG-928-C03]MDL2311845.1 acetate kinase [Bacteroidales bacterium OttesenSCG-928-B11]MDL2325506.1 acetate kinase [Bacteroidales bacterium OttesenSCG-928-A14]
MKILVLNCGSSSIKYQLIDMANNAELLAKGLVERIGLDMGIFTHKPEGKEKYNIETPIKDHEVGIGLVLNALTDTNHGVIASLNEIGAVGHRVAHGGEYFSKSTILKEKERAEIEKLCELAPLHNPASLLGIDVMTKLLPTTPQVGVFDTSFHQTMPKEAYLYAIPYKYYTEDKIRRYGFHGTSHKFVAPKAANLLGKNYEDMKIIVCHLGNGASICAIKNGKSVDTSMGFTPVEGLVMGTRCGDLDSGALIYIAEKEGLSYKEMNTLINKKSGICGLTNGTMDMRDVSKGRDAGDETMTNAFNCFAYRVKKYIGAYAAAMDGVDLIVMTGGIGENAQDMREAVLKDLTFFGVDFDANANNNSRGEDVILTKPGSRTIAMAITTNEELVIATDTYNLVK